MTKYIPAGETIINISLIKVDMKPAKEHLQLSAVQGLIDFPLLNLFHGFLWVVYFHLDVLDFVSDERLRQSHARLIVGHTVMIFFSGRVGDLSPDALRFPSFAASRTGISEGIVTTCEPKALPPSKTFQQ
jgi:hypothetical protein